MLLLHASSAKELCLLEAVASGVVRNVAPRSVGHHFDPISRSILHADQVGCDGALQLVDRRDGIEGVNEGLDGCVRTQPSSQHRVTVGGAGVNARAGSRRGNAPPFLPSTNIAETRSESSSACKSAGVTKRDFMTVFSMFCHTPPKSHTKSHTKKHTRWLCHTKCRGCAHAHHTHSVSHTHNTHSVTTMPRRVSHDSLPGDKID